MTKNVYPIFDQILDREAKEQLLNQRGLVLWFLGLSGSGKSTLAKHLQVVLHDKGFLTQVLDGDNMRSGLTKDLGFSQEDRVENIRRVSEVAQLFGNCGIITICSFISPQEKNREMAKSIVGDLWYEVFVDTPLDICEKRDVKGLYQKARKGELKNFTGIDAPFDIPKHPNLVVKTENREVNDAVEYIYMNIKNIITKK